MACWVVGLGAGVLRGQEPLSKWSVETVRRVADGSAQERLKHVLRLVEREPETEVLRSPLARFVREDFDEKTWARAVALWKAARGDAGKIAWNAANFFRGLDAGEHERYLVEAVRRQPGNAMAIRELADWCAVALGEVGARRGAAEKVLAASENPWLLGNVAHQMYLRGVDRAEGYFLRARMLEPGIRQEVVFPERREVAAPKVLRLGKVKRVAIREFRELPPGLAEWLTQRGCTVPQVGGDKQRRNVIPGEFFAKGEKGWAVLCSVREKSSILVFRNEGDRAPAVLAAREDSEFQQDLGGEAMEYSRMIRAVGKEFIVKHHRAYGGPKVPAIDHEGIDDAFVGKASMVWYWVGGKWVRLQGAD
ncbi:hypothetical protein WDZ92_38530 [Nostoc sp. NIES-2111]